LNAASCNIIRWVENNIHDHIFSTGMAVGGGIYDLGNHLPAHVIGQIDSCGFFSRYADPGDSQVFHTTVRHTVAAYHPSQTCRPPIQHMRDTRFTIHNAQWASVPAPGAHKGSHRDHVPCVPNFELHDIVFCSAAASVEVFNDVNLIAQRGWMPPEVCAERTAMVENKSADQPFHIRGHFFPGVPLPDCPIVADHIVAFGGWESRGELGNQRECVAFGGEESGGELGNQREYVVHD
jgi:hypothetical protein